MRVDQIGLRCVAVRFRLGAGRGRDICTVTIEAPAFAGTREATLLIRQLQTYLLRVAQAEALDFAGLGFWQDICEDHRARVFIGGDGGFDMGLQGFCRALVGLVACG